MSRNGAMGGTTGPLTNNEDLASTPAYGHNKIIGAMPIPSGFGTGSQQENAAIMEALNQGL